MTKIWILKETNSYDETNIVGVFSTEEKAKVVMQMLKREECINIYELRYAVLDSEFENWKRILEERMNDYNEELELLNKFKCLA